MSKREIFERVKAHLLEQGVQSVDDRGNCRYRGINGTACAVGCLISDENYSDLHEGFCASDRDVTYAIERSLGCAIDAEMEELMLALQICHDEFPPHDWPAQLDSIERKYVA
jgi:hypothetical protein